MRHWRFSTLIVCLILFIPVQGPVQGQALIQKCTICHGKVGFKKIDAAGKTRILYVDEDEIARSIHGKKTCTDCHFDVVEIPHRTRPERVQCTRCHYKGNPEGAPQSDKYLEYKESIHGKEVEKGDPKAPLCQDCHGNHNIRKAKDPFSLVARAVVAKTCGACHMEIYGQYINSIHGRAAYAEGNPDSPTCTGCHGEHNIFAKNEPRSTIYPPNVSKTCAHCHAAVGIVGKYGIEVEQVATYEESFHGIAVQFGSKTVANCASCHGIHDIRSPDDPLSMININNIPRTCGKCHRGANINYARGKIHVNPSSRKAGIVFYVAFFFKWLTILVMLGLIVHIGMDLYRRSSVWREKKKETRT